MLLMLPGDGHDIVLQDSSRKDVPSHLPPYSSIVCFVLVADLIPFPQVVEQSFQVFHSFQMQSTTIEIQGSYLTYLSLQLCYKQKIANL